MRPNPWYAALVAVVVLGAPASPGHAQTSETPVKRAFEVADFYRTVFVGAPRLSPDGARVVFTVTRQELEAGERWSEIWRMEADGSGLRQMTTGRHQDADPVFSPDGSTILFGSDRGDGGQLWAMPVDGGEPRRLTDFSPGLSGARYTPDGKRIVAVAELYPECGVDVACHERIAQAAETGKLAVHVADALLFRHWTSWRDGLFSHLVLLDAATGEVTKDLTPGAWDAPTFSLGGARGFDVTPDGKTLVYVSNHAPDPAESTDADLWRVDLDAEIGPETAVLLTAGNDGWDGAPLFSPDGARLAWLSQVTPGYESDLYRLRVLDLATGAAATLTDRGIFDDWIDDFAWVEEPAGGAPRILFVAEVEGRTPLYGLDPASGKIEPLLTDATLDGWAAVPGGDAVVYSRRSVGEPPEIRRAALPGGAPERLTRFNADLEAEVDLRPAEELWVPGAGGHPIHVFLVKPHGFDPAKRYPLILNVHGGPQSQWADAYRGDWQVYPGKGYVVAFANPTGSTGYGQAFTDAIACDWGGAVYEDLMKVTDALAALPWVDEERMGAMGWSYGGYMMMWFAGHTTRFRALAAMMGIFDLRSFYGATEELWFPEKDLCGTPWDSEAYERFSPSNHVDAFATPTLVLTGERDYRVPYTQSLQFFTALQKKGVPSRLVVFPKAGHWPAWQEMAFYYNAHVDWFHRFLGGEPATWDVLEHARNLAFGQGAKSE